nr:S-layer homology domain-containing protein [Bacillus benzoevorans]
MAASTSPDELQTNLTQLSNTSSTIAAQFGKNVSAQEIQELIIGTAIEFYNRLKTLNPNATEAEINTALENAVTAVIISSIQNNQDLATVFLKNISIDEVKKAVSEIIAKVDPKGEVRKAFLHAVKKVENGTPGGGGGGGTDPDPGQPQPIPYPPGPGEAKVPADAAVIEKITSNGQTQFVTKVQANKVDEIVGLISGSNNVIVLPLPQAAEGEINKALIPGAFFTKAQAKDPNAILYVKTAEAGYKLPVNAINIADLAQKLGVAADAVSIEITVNIVDANQVQGAIAKNKLNPVSKVIEFTVRAVAGDKAIEISKFSTYVKRTIVGHKNFNPDRTAALRLEGEKYQSTPAVFAGNEGTIFKRDNSKYVIVENDKTFTDIDNGRNFAEYYIEKLASKYIIFGKSETSYAPSDAITRGEFAALISRSFGLTAQNPTALKFPDTPNTKAVNQNGEINAAAEAGIINGYGDGNFRPDKPINRAEAAIMIAKAMEYVNVADSKYDKTKKLASFKDDAAIGASSRASVEKVYQAGIISGFANGEFGPDKSMQRDQMAVVLEKVLKAAELIN